MRAISDRRGKLTRRDLARYLTDRLDHIADAKARVERIHQIMETGAWNGDVADSLNNLVITHLREAAPQTSRTQ